MDLHHPVDTFGDTPRQLARRDLALPGQHQQTAAHSGDDDRLHQHHAKSHHAQIDMLEQDEHQRRQRLAPQVHRGDQGFADKPAQRFNFVLDHGRHFG